jgi:hypothetical protein
MAESMKKTLGEMLVDEGISPRTSSRGEHEQRIKGGV